MTAIVALGLRVVLAGLLYGFLVWILSILWREIKQQGALLASQNKHDIHLEARMENGWERKYHFRQAEITIGRNTNCDISLTDDVLSAQHVRISYHHTQWWLEDLDSKNGTFLNRNPVTVPTVIITDDEFKCGNTTFTIIINSLEDKSSHSNAS